MTDIDRVLAGWQAVCDAATPEPWHLNQARNAIIQVAHITRDVWTIPHRDGDMPFVAASRTAMPRLIAALREAMQELESISVDHRESLARIEAILKGEQT